MIVMIKSDLKHEIYIFVFFFLQRYISKTFL